MSKHNNQNQINDTGDIYNYLVTQSVDTKGIGEDKISSDMNLLTKAEEKQDYKTDISRNIKNPQIKRAVSSLKLSNPFKGF